MNAERWQQVKTIFHRAVERDPATRAQFLRESCGSDEELRREVESLLDSEENPGSLLETAVMGPGAMAAAAPAPRDDGMIGRTIGNYVITGELARGGMGIVYRARHVTLPREAVVKCIRPLGFSEESQKELRARFRREAHIQCQLDHPHIVRVYEFFDLAEEYFLVMEYVPGSSVRSMLDECGRLPPERAAALAVQALEGLAHAHGLHYVDESGNSGVGIIHRDIKPGNLLVDEQGNLKLADFGIAKVRGEGQLTKTGFNPGTVEYMSPEQIRGLPVDARSDLYSLGATLYQMLAGRVPYPGTDSDSGYDLLKAHVETDPPPIQTLNPEIPAWLADIVTRSLNRDPDQRWQTADEFREALLAHQEPIVRSPQRVMRRWAMAAGVAALTLAAVLASAFWLGRGAKSPQPAQITPSIAVLPFTDLSEEKNLAYFGDGMAEELMTDLAQTPGLRVTGRTSAFRFRDKAEDPRAIAKKLHVTALLEGSVRKQGSQTRITVQLIDAANGFYLWTQAYQRDMGDIFAVQDEIARAVTGALKVTLLGEKTAPSRKPPNAEAYNAYLQGRYFLQRAGKANLEKAIFYFERATNLDAAYAPAWVGLGESHGWQANGGYVSVEEGNQKAREEVERALGLDGNLAEAHVAMGQIQMFHDWDWAGAEASYQRALALEPGKASAIALCGYLDRITGRLDDAIALGRRVMQIDPLRPDGYHNAGISLYYAGRYEEATAAFQKALELAPEKEFTHNMLAEVYLAQSHPNEALAEAEKEKDAGLRLCGLALANYALGRKEGSDRNLAELKAKFASEYQAAIAEVHAFRGETDEAFEWLERAYTQRDSGIIEMKVDTLLKNLRSDPRYAALLKKMRLN